MKTTITLQCYGQSFAPTDWSCNRFTGIHRLYYIHQGTGYCRHNGRKIPFSAGRLYFIPFTEDFTPYSDPRDPILHSYADFELIPPILTDEILEADPSFDEEAQIALSVFTAGAKRTEHLPKETEFEEFCKESIAFLCSYAAKQNGIPHIADEVICKALERIHQRIDEPLSIEDLARACYMNRDSFLRRFKRVVGIPPHTYRKRLRLHTARCLRAQGLSYEQIARKTGYADASSLLHALKSGK